MCGLALGQGEIRMKKTRVVAMMVILSAYLAIGYSALYAQDSNAILEQDIGMMVHHARTLSTMLAGVPRSVPGDVKLTVTVLGAAKRLEEAGTSGVITGGCGPSQCCGPGQCLTTIMTCDASNAQGQSSCNAMCAMVASSQGGVCSNGVSGGCSCRF